MSLPVILHVTAGTIGLLSGTAAVSVRKGGQLHRVFGTVFFASMLVMAVFACYLAVTVPGQIVNLFIGTFTIYLVATAWLTVRRKAGTVGLSEKIALFVAIGLCAPFAILAVQLAAGLPPLFESAVPLKGPVLIAIYGFTAVLAIAAISDAKLVLAGGISGAPRIARHLWRMCLGLTLAAGSASTNGLPRLFPGPVRVTLIFFLPQLLVLALLVFWMIRVRFTNWLPDQATSDGPLPLRAGFTLSAEKSNEGAH